MSDFTRDFQNDLQDLMRWRRDVRFRRALSMAINRHEINQVVFFGLAIEGNNTVLPKCPLFKPEYQTEWSQFDLDQANALLDEMGLTSQSGYAERASMAEQHISPLAEAPEHAPYFSMILVNKGADPWLTPNP